MRLGFHVSISGGLVKAVERGAAIGCEALQIFSRSPRVWAGRPLELEEIAAFRAARAAAGLFPLAVHLHYLPNLASSQPELYRKSVSALVEELDRAGALGAEFLVFHPGRLGPDQSIEDGLDRLALASAEALKPGQKHLKPMLLLENTAGRRGELGAGLEELAQMLNLIRSAAGPAIDLGICLDTAHAWGAGYDLSRPKSQDKFLSDLDRILGLERLKLIHLNDSLVPLGSRLDRHAALGEGRIGARGLARLIRHPALYHLAGIMETPHRTAEDSRRDLARARQWRERRLRTSGSFGP